MDFVDLFHDRAQYLVELQRRGKGLAKLLEHCDFARFAAHFQSTRTPTAVYGRKLFGLFHAGHFLSSAHAAHSCCKKHYAVGSLVESALLRQYRHRAKSGATSP